jgi:hypothetical protein
MKIEINTNTDIDINIIEKAESLDEYARTITALDLAKDILLKEMQINTNKYIVRENQDFMQGKKEVGADKHTLSIKLYN